MRLGISKLKNSVFRLSLRSPFTIFVWIKAEIVVMKKNIRINWRRLASGRWRLALPLGVVIVVAVVAFWLNGIPFRSGFEIADDLGGNIFPSSILSVATTDAQVIVPSDSVYVGLSLIHI